jgi:PhnB protein
MQVNPYLFYNGNCEGALTYYQKALGAQIGAVLP